MAKQRIRQLQGVGAGNRTMGTALAAAGAPSLTPNGNPGQRERYTRRVAIQARGVWGGPISGRTIRAFFGSYRRGGYRRGG